MERIINRLDKYMILRNLNDNKVSIQCKLSIGLLGKARKRDSDIGKSSVEKILKFYTEINPDWLKFGTGKMILERNNEQNTIFETQKSQYSIADLSRIDKLIENNTILAEAVKRQTLINENLTNKLLETLKKPGVRKDVECADVG